MRVINKLSLQQLLLRMVHTVLGVVYFYKFNGVYMEMTNG